jgi:MFS family permease
MLALVRSRSDALSELVLATCAMAASNLYMVGVASLIPLVRHDLPLGPVEIGAAAATPSFAALLSVRSASGLILRWGPGATIGVSQVVCAVGGAITAVAPNLEVFFAGMIVGGLGFGIVSPPANILSMGLISARHRGLAMSIKQTGVTLGGVVAGLLLPSIAVATSWRDALVVPIALSLAMAAWGFATRAHGSREPLVLAERTISLRRGRLGLYGFAMSGVQLTIFGYATVYLVDEVGFSPELAGVGFAVALAAGSVGRIGWGIVSDRARDRLRVLQLVSAGSMLVLSLFPFASSVTVWPLLVALGLCSIGWNGVFQAVVAESAGVAGIARATAYVLPFLFVGAIVVPPLLGFVVDRASWSWFWWAGALGAAVAALAFTRAHAPAGSTG